MYINDGLNGTTKSKNTNPRCNTDSTIEEVAKKSNLSDAINIDENGVLIILRAVINRENWKTKFASVIFPSGKTILKFRNHNPKVSPIIINNTATIRYIMDVALNTSCNFCLTPSPKAYEKYLCEVRVRALFKKFINTTIPETAL